MSNKTENNTGRILFKTTSPKGLPFLMVGDTTSDNSLPEPSKRQPRPGTVERHFPASLQWEDKVTGETKGFKGVSAMDQRQTLCDSVVLLLVYAASIQQEATRAPRGGGLTLMGKELPDGHTCQAHCGVP